MFKRVWKGYWNLNVKMFNRIASTVEKHPWLPLVSAGVLSAVLISTAPSGGCQ